MTANTLSIIKSFFMPQFLEKRLKLSIVPVGFACYAILLVILRIWFCHPNLSYDEAEQIVFAQALTLGYPSQPPLYTWLQYFVFKIFGLSLFSVVLLKFFLFVAALYVYWCLCSYYCKSKLLSWVTTISWVLIPNISYDFLPHRTHVILALLLSALTWYYLVKSRYANKLHYCGFGILIGLGVLSKFNYLIFFGALFSSALTIKEYREKLLRAEILLSFILALLIASPYIWWLTKHQALGFAAAYKFTINQGKSYYGFISLAKVLFCFSAPLLGFSIFLCYSHNSKIKLAQLILDWQKQRVNIRLLRKLATEEEVRGDTEQRTGMYIEVHDDGRTVSTKQLPSVVKFPKKSINDQPAISLLWRYHLMLLPLLCLLIAGTNVNNVRTHWLVPLLFMLPLCIWQIASPKPDHLKRYIGLCLLIQALLVTIWINRVPKSAEFPLTHVFAKVKQEPRKINAIVSDSHWLLASLMLFIHKPGILIHLTNATDLPKNALIIWEGSTMPWWVSSINFFPSSNLSVVQKLKLTQSYSLMYYS